MNTASTPLSGPESSASKPHADGRPDETHGLRYPCGAPPAPGEVREVAPGVLWLRMPLPFSLNHINLWAR